MTKVAGRIEREKREQCPRVIFVMKARVLCLLLLATAACAAAPWRFTADKLEYLPSEDRASVEGSVLLETEELTLTADAGELFFQRQRAELTNVKGKANGYRLQAERAVAAPGETQLYGAKLTGCSLPKPEYYLTSKQVRLVDNQMLLQGNRLHLFRLPALPLPTLRAYANEPLLLPVPHLGSSSTRGAWGGLTIPKRFSENASGSFTLLGSVKKGLIAGQNVAFKGGSWQTEAFARWEAGLLGGVKLQRNGWQLVAQKELWSSEFDQPLLIVPEVSYGTGGELAGLSVAQNFSAGRIKEGNIASYRLRSQTSLAGSWQLGEQTLQASSLFSAARYRESQLLALCLTASLGRSWQLGDATFSAALGGTYKRAAGRSPFQHDAISSATDLIFSGSLKKGPWHLAVGKVEQLNGKAQLQATIRKDGHCFYWQLGYEQTTQSLNLELGMR